jgi:hypothetical protein
MTAVPEPLRLFDTDALGVLHGETANKPLAQASLQRVCLSSRLVAQAQDRFAAAVLSARSGGCSWRNIGTAAGVPYRPCTVGLVKPQLANDSCLVATFRVTLVVDLLARCPGYRARRG